MRAVFTVPVVTVGCDAKYTDAGPGRLHLNVCVCGRIESFAGRMSEFVGCAGETSTKLLHLRWQPLGRRAHGRRACGRAVRRAVEQTCLEEGIPAARAGRFTKY